VAEIQPFPGILYGVPETELPRLLAPPYDVIPPAYQDELYARDPRNVVRLELNRTPGDAGYAEAGETFRRWREEGVLVTDKVPALYAVEQTFTVDDKTRRRFGLLARFRAVDASERVILPHEQTRAGAREDRFKALRATRANFSPIFMMFSDSQSRFSPLLADLIGHPPALRYTDDGGVAHRVWRVTEPGLVSAFRELLAGARAYIADGHHRYATALRYRDDAGPEGAWTFGYFTPMAAPGLVVLPYHRILSEGPSLADARKRLAAHFDLSDAPDVRSAAAAVAASTRPHAFALAQPGAGALVAESRESALALVVPDAPPSLRALDTYFVHQVVLGRLLEVPDSAVRYVHSLREAEEAVASSAARLAVLLRATPVQQIVDVSEAGESMPAKSTFFHPKLPSGLVIHPLVV
jgi:uncharacterized protein (DUF1015 family)